MKLTNPEAIQESEKEFIDTINAELDWEAIEKMLLEKHNFTLQEEIEYKEGDLIVYHDEIAYKFDFEIKVPLSVIFNREGDCLEISTKRNDFEEQDIDDPGDIEGLDDMQDLEDIQDMHGHDEQDQDDIQTLEDIQDQNESVNEESVQQGQGSTSFVPKGQENKVAQMASNIADMISEINQGDE
ncbi:MAG: hypothetical protein ABIJ31_00740 [Pseudomonadota bacterium]